jgi:hypothetical protein
MHRLFIYFKAEDPFMYTRRVAEAYQLRDWVESMLVGLRAYPQVKRTRSLSTTTLSLFGSQAGTMCARPEQTGAREPGVVHVRHSER